MLISGGPQTCNIVTYISSRVGVTYPMKVISRNGTWRTDFDRKSKPSRSLSSQVA